MSKKIIFFGILLLVTISVGLVYAQETGGGGGTAPTPAKGGGGGGGAGGNYTIEYDPEILDAFENQTWLPVLVRLRDNSNVDNFLNSLSENDFKGERGSSKIAFVGFINENGFKTLLNDSRVKKISWTKYGASIALENKSKSKDVSETEKEPESGTITNVSISEDVSVPEGISEEKTPIWSWMIIAVIVLSIVFYLIIKSKKK